MKILAIEKEIPGHTDDDFKPHAKAEAAKVWEPYQAGIFRELYFRQDRSEAVLVLECVDIEEANDVLNTLPLVKAELITFDVIPLEPVGGHEVCRKTS
jgi:hypothetical protein